MIGSQRVLSEEDLDELLKEAFSHLTEGRHRMALSAAQKVFDHRQDDYRCAICLAWAYLENGEPDNALEYADMAVQLGLDIPTTRLYRGFILMRMGIFEGAIQDLDFVIDAKSEPLSWAHHLKAKALAGMGRYQEAFEEFDYAMRADRGTNKVFPKLREWYKKAAGQATTVISQLKKTEKPLIEDAEDAFKAKEFWFTMWAINKVLADPSKEADHLRAKLLQLETMYALFQFKPALAKAKTWEQEFPGDARFESILNKLVNTDRKNQPPKEEEKPAPPVAEEPTQVGRQMEVKRAQPQVITIKRKTEFVRMDDSVVIALYAKTFDLVIDLESGNRIYYLQFAENRVQYIGIEVIMTNPYYDIKDTAVKGTAVWFLNENEVGKHDFEVAVDREWRNVVFVQSWGADGIGFWKRGQGRVDIFINGEKICERWFLIGQNDIPSSEEFDLQTIEEEISRKMATRRAAPEAGLTADTTEPIAASLAELDSFTGLNSVKQSMRDFISYLEFLRERKKLGLKTQEGLSVNSVFLGNPGTGKTSVARVLGNIFKAMGILEKGHVVEVDRSSLVGQYIGETAQKTEKIIEDAMGGLLFIDEAYTLVKKGGSGQDFGQEAIDTLLKRIEDKAGQFAVIVAGYPDEMNDFLTANPGMKSRFTHTFNFEDYTPEEMVEIFKGMSKKEEYSVEEEAIAFLIKEFTNLYRKRDKTFGNARLVRNIFNDTKMQLSKRYLKLPEKLRDKKALTTIKAEDITEVFKGVQNKAFKLEIDEESLTKALDKLNSLTGLASVKKDVNELVKLARYYLDIGESIQSKFSDHVLFLGNPGTGKTTVARIVSQIYAALGLLPKGHLVEADRQSLVATHVGETAAKTTALINQAIGGTFFIDEAYALVKEGDTSDFGKEAIDTLLKRMEDDRGKFICIAAGYTDDMKRFIESNPGMQSRFTKIFTFEDYAPEELMVIARALFRDKDLELDPPAEEKLLGYFHEIYRSRDKNFGNARLVRNLVEAAARNQLLRLVDIPKEQRTPENSRRVLFEDLKDVISKKPAAAKPVAVQGNKELLDGYMKELNELTGLDSVKKSVDRLISSLKVAKLREERGLQVLRKNLHAVFLGNPGTGKTTVARLISKIYKEMGLLEKGHLVEVDRNALVAGYQGQTAAKTDEIITKSLGGTLFIDEAYTLVRGGDSFGQEAIDTLLKRMEDYRDSLVIIVAGYTNEMKAFIDSNPGMQSRFTNVFEFEDYNPRQMLEIAGVISEKSGYTLDEGALQALLEIFTNQYKNRDRNFGNARTVRNILYKAIGNQEERILTVKNPTDTDLITVTLDDVQGIRL